MTAAISPTHLGVTRYVYGFGIYEHAVKVAVVVHVTGGDVLGRSRGTESAARKRGAITQAYLVIPTITRYESVEIPVPVDVSEGNCPTVRIIGTERRTGKGTRTVSQTQPILLEGVREYCVEVTVEIHVAQRDISGNGIFGIDVTTGKSSKTVSKTHPVWHVDVRKDSVEMAVTIDVSEGNAVGAGDRRFHRGTTRLSIGETHLIDLSSVCEYESDAVLSTNRGGGKYQHYQCHD